MKAFLFPDGGEDSYHVIIQPIRRWGQIRRCRGEVRPCKAHGCGHTVFKGTGSETGRLQGEDGNFQFLIKNPHFKQFHIPYFMNSLQKVYDLGIIETILQARTRSCKRFTDLTEDTQPINFRIKTRIRCGCLQSPHAHGTFSQLHRNEVCIFFKSKNNWHTILYWLQV